MKAVLVMDMPEHCIDCPCHRPTADDRVAWCGAEQCDFTTGRTETYKAEWCPLVPMPERKEELTLKEGAKHPFTYGANAGWNACIDALERSEG